MLSVIDSMFNFSMNYGVISSSFVLMVLFCKAQGDRQSIQILTSVNGHLIIGMGVRIDR